MLWSFDHGEPIFSQAVLWGHMNDALQGLLPKDKLDVDAVRRLSAKGYPAIEPILPALLEWMQDLNWPVAQALHPFLVSLGEPLAPHIRSILRTDDDIWKYWVLICVVAESPSLLSALKLELEHLAEKPTDGEREELIDELARNMLRRLDNGSSQSVMPESYRKHNEALLGLEPHEQD